MKLFNFGATRHKPSCYLIYQNILGHMRACYGPANVCVAVWLFDRLCLFVKVLLDETKKNFPEPRPDNDKFVKLFEQSHLDEFNNKVDEYNGIQNPQNGVKQQLHSEWVKPEYNFSIDIVS